MPHRAVLDALYEYAATGKDLTRATLATPMGNDPDSSYVCVVLVKEVFYFGFTG